MKPKEDTYLEKIFSERASAISMVYETPNNTELLLSVVEHRQPDMHIGTITSGVELVFASVFYQDYVSNIELFDRLISEYYEWMGL